MYVISYGCFIHSTHHMVVHTKMMKLKDVQTSKVTRININNKCIFPCRYTQHKLLTFSFYRKSPNGNFVHAAKYRNENINFSRYFVSHFIVFLLRECVHLVEYSDLQLSWIIQNSIKCQHTQNIYIYMFVKYNKCVYCVNVYEDGTIRVCSMLVIFPFFLIHFASFTIYHSAIGLSTRKATNKINLFYQEDFYFFFFRYKKKTFEFRTLCLLFILRLLQWWHSKRFYLYLTRINSDILQYTYESAIAWNLEKNIETREHCEVKLIKVYINMICFTPHLYIVFIVYYIFVASHCNKNIIHTNHKIKCAFSLFIEVVSVL